MARIEQYAARGVWDPPTYSQAVKVTGAETILYIAGQVAYDDNGNAAHAGDFKAQARATLQAVKAQVEAGGGTMANIVKVNTYLTDIRHRADCAAIEDTEGALSVLGSDEFGHGAVEHRGGAVERDPDQRQNGQSRCQRQRQQG